MTSSVPPAATTPVILLESEANSNGCVPGLYQRTVMPGSIVMSCGLKPFGVTVTMTVSTSPGDKSGAVVVTVTVTVADVQAGKINSVSTKDDASNSRFDLFIISFPFTAPIMKATTLMLGQMI